MNKEELNTATKSALSNLLSLCVLGIIYFYFIYIQHSEIGMNWATDYTENEIMGLKFVDCDNWTFLLGFNTHRYTQSTSS